MSKGRPGQSCGENAVDLEILDGLLSIRDILSLLVLVDIFLKVHNCAGFLMKLESCENLQCNFKHEVRLWFGAANLGGIPLNTLAPTPHSAWWPQMHILQFSPGNQSVTAVRCLSKIGISNHQQAASNHLQAASKHQQPPASSQVAAQCRRVASDVQAGVFAICLCVFVCICVFFVFAYLFCICVFVIRCVRVA